jgi:hypothetical protein
MQELDLFTVSAHAYIASNKRWNGNPWIQGDVDYKNGRLDFGLEYEVDGCFFSNHR